MRHKLHLSLACVHICRYWGSVRASCNKDALPVLFRVLCMRTFICDPSVHAFIHQKKKTTCWAYIACILKNAHVNMFCQRNTSITESRVCCLYICKHLRHLSVCMPACTNQLWSCLQKHKCMPLCTKTMIAVSRFFAQPRMYLRVCWAHTPNLIDCEHLCVAKACAGVYTRVYTSQEFYMWMHVSNCWSWAFKHACLACILCMYTHQLLFSIEPQRSMRICSVCVYRDVFILIEHWRPKCIPWCTCKHAWKICWLYAVQSWMRWLYAWRSRWRSIVCFRSKATHALIQQLPTENSGSLCSMVS